MPGFERGLAQARRGGGEERARELFGRLHWLAEQGVRVVPGVTGRLEPGPAADLVVVHGDPLADLDALTRIELVMARGRLHRPPPRSVDA